MCSSEKLVYSSWSLFGGFPDVAEHLFLVGVACDSDGGQYDYDHYNHDDGFHETVRCLYYLHLIRVRFYRQQNSLNLTQS